MEKKKFRCYIPFGSNAALLKTCVDSINSQIKDFSSYSGKQILIANNSQYEHIESEENVEIYIPDFEMVPAQEINLFLKMAIKNNEDFVMNINSDAEIFPGAMQDLFERYEEIKYQQWGTIVGAAGGHTLALVNIKFFQEEDVWFDPFLFPFYFTDNHTFNLMRLRGWPMFFSHTTVCLCKHQISHYINENPAFKKKNDLTFDNYRKLYSAIWGGLPGREINKDPTLNGLYPRKDK